MNEKLCLVCVMFVFHCSIRAFQSDKATTTRHSHARHSKFLTALNKAMFPTILYQ